MTETKQEIESDKKLKACEKTFCEPSVKKSVEFVKPLFKKKTRKEIQRFIKLKQHDCRRTYCNPKCKGTLLQDKMVTDKELIDDILIGNPKANIKEALKFSKKMRKNVFKGRKTVLDGDFYHGLTKKRRKELLKKGAISGCEMPMVDMFSKSSEKRVIKSFAKVLPRVAKNLVKKHQ